MIASVRRIGASAVVHLKLLVRNPAQVIGSLGLAVISMVVFGLMFKPSTAVAVGVAPAPPGWIHWPDLHLVAGRAGALIASLRRGNLDGVLVRSGTGYTGWVNPAYPVGSSAAIDAMTRIVAVLAHRPLPMVTRTVAHGRHLTTLDWLAPGLLGSLLMWANFYVGAHLAQWREHGLTRRLGATALRPGEFILGQALAQLSFSLSEAALFLVLGRVAFGLRLPQAMGLLALVVLAGTGCLMSMGYLIGALSSRAQGANALALLVAFPMMFLGGTYFTVTSLGGTLGLLVRIIPLSHLNAALRSIMDGGTRALTGSLDRDLAVLVAWTAAAGLAAARWTRWEARS